jgi:hypothetical protein
VTHALKLLQTERLESSMLSKWIYCGQQIKMCIIPFLFLRPSEIRQSEAEPTKHFGFCFYFPFISGRKLDLLLFVTANSLPGFGFLSATRRTATRKEVGFAYLTYQGTSLLLDVPNYLIYVANQDFEAYFLPYRVLRRSLISNGILLVGDFFYI